MAYWALAADPDRYRIEDAVEALQLDWWNFGKSAVVEGDYVVMWKYLGSGKRRGIVALGWVVEGPEIRSEAANPFWIDQGDELVEPAPRVLVKYLRPPRLPLWVEEAQPSSVVHELSVSRTRGGGTTFHVTEAQWTRLIDEVGGPPRYFVC